MDIKEWKARKFQEALDRLLEVDSKAIFKGIHRMNEILSERRIPHPMKLEGILDLGIVVGAILIMQECAPEKNPQ